MSDRIRVKRSELVKAVEGRLRKMNAEHKRRRDALPAERARYLAACVVGLRKALAAAEAGRIPTNSYGTDIRVAVGMSPPTTLPARSRDACKLERILKSLKIGADETISINPDDADTYFGPCQV